MGCLSTHVLDTARGLPAPGVTIELHAVGKDSTQLRRKAVTNDDGRTAEPLLSGNHLETGVYQLHFHVGDYFRALGFSMLDPPFLDVVVIQFGIADPSANYHVPLLISPYGYSTYRGS